MSLTRLSLSVIESSFQVTAYRAHRHAGWDMASDILSPARAPARRGAAGERARSFPYLHLGVPAARNFRKAGAGCILIREMKLLIREMKFGSGNEL